jgi:hypothetical protein
LSQKHHLLLTNPDSNTEKSAKMAAVQIPENSTYIDTMKRNFTSVTVDPSNGNAINTEEFLDAAESLTSMFGKHYTAVSPESPD